MTLNFVYLKCQKQTLWRHGYGHLQYVQRTKSLLDMEVWKSYNILDMKHLNMIANNDRIYKFNNLLLTKLLARHAV